MPEFVSIGEVMIQLSSLEPGPLRHSRLLEVRVAGSEANMLVGLTRLGHTSGLMSRVGDDEFGRLVLRVLRGEGVDTSRVSIDPEAPTGIYFVQRHYPVPGKSVVYYYRHGSAASRMGEGDVDEEYIASSRALILTGITPALSGGCYRASEKALEKALRSGVDVIFDTNIRMRLWRSRERAREGVARFLRGPRIVFTNDEDLEILFPGLSVGEAVEKLSSLGAEVVVVKMGSRGAAAYSRGRLYRRGAFAIPGIEDVVGSGDAFNAAFLASILRGDPVEKALEYGNAAGAMNAAVRGDIEALPSWKDLEDFLGSYGAGPAG